MYLMRPSPKVLRQYILSLSRVNYLLIILVKCLPYRCCSELIKSCGASSVLVVSAGTKGSEQCRGLGTTQEFIMERNF